MPVVLNQRRDTIPKDALNCARPGPWGNPIRMRGRSAVERERVVAEYTLRVHRGEIDVRGIGTSERDWQTNLRTAPALVCWCAPEPCHCDVLANIADGRSYQNPESNERVAIVCGGRDYSDYELLFRKLGTEHAREPFGLIVHGGAQGADSLAGRCAREFGIPTKVYRPDWNRHGRAAGYRRNKTMLDATADSAADIIAFPGGRGTGHMVKLGYRAGRRLIIIKE